MNKQESLHQKVGNYFTNKGESVSSEDINGLIQIVGEYLSHPVDSVGTDKKLADNQSGTHDRYPDLFENAPVGYFILDSNYRIQKINNTACSQLNFNCEEILGEYFSKFVDEDYHKLFQTCLQELHAGSNESKCDLKLKKTDSDVFVRLIIRLSMPGSESENYRIAFLDISKEKELEKKLLETAKKARENERLNTDFMKNISHEIRTPMNGIIGFSELLQDPDLSPEKLQSYINTIQHSGKRMLSLINELVDISKIESGSVRPVSVKTNVDELLEYLQELFLPEAQKKELKLEINPKNPENSLIVKTDKEKLHAIFIILIKNAVNYTNEGSITFGYQKKNEVIQFFVKDTGRGIPEQEQARIFSRFYRSGIKDDNSVDGAGLGLSLSKAYVEMLGGEIWVESEPEKGSVFYFTIPAIYTDDKNGEIERPLHFVKDPVELLKQLTILIAEDDEPARLYLFELLKNSCNQLFFAKNGREAVEMYSEIKPNLVFMDIKMPVMDGYSAAIKIKGMDENAMIIAQTAYALAGDREKALAAGCSDYLTKPVLKVDLLEMIQKHFM